MLPLLPLLLLFRVPCYYYFFRFLVYLHTNTRLAPDYFHSNLVYSHSHTHEHLHTHECDVRQKLAVKWIRVNTTKKNKFRQQQRKRNEEIVVET